MRIVCISDTHLAHVKHRIEVPDGDVLIHAGDATLRGTNLEVAAFSDWFSALPHNWKLFIPGNHDIGFEERESEAQNYLHCGIIYLRDEGLTIDGLNFWGSPWQPEFCNWAFNLKRGRALREKWAMIPDNTDVLITHGPPHMVMDGVWSGQHAGGREHVGCKDLMDRVLKVKPKLHVFGHVHSGYGITKLHDITFVNAATCDSHYEPVNKPIVVDVEARVELAA